MALAIEVNNSTTELHLPDVAKEKLVIIDSKCRLLIEANLQLQTRMTVWALRQILSRFHPWRASIRPSSPIVFQPLRHLSRLLNNVEHSSKCDGLAEERFTSFEEQKLDCNICSIKYGERRQRLINAINVILYPCISFCSALKASLQLKN